MGANQFSGPEAAKRSVLATLQTYVPTELAAIRSAFNDGLTPPNPKSYLSNYRLTIAQYPAIMVSSYGGGQVKADGSPIWLEMEHHIEATGVLQTNKLEILETQAERLLQAMIEAIALHPKLDNNTYGAASIGRYGRALHAQEKGKTAPLTMSVALEILVITQEPL